MVLPVPVKQSAVDRSQAVRSCVGYLVDSPDGRIGMVREIRYQRRRRTQPTALVVGAGQNGACLLVIPISQLAGISTSDRRVVLRASPHIITAVAPGAHGDHTRPQ
jgi:hypothetical protein